MSGAAKPSRFFCRCIYIRRTHYIGVTMFKMIVFSFLVIFPREIKADFPKLNKRELIIYANPATLEGKLVKRHLETDWIAYATKKTSDKEILKTIGEYEAR